MRRCVYVLLITFFITTISTAKPTVVASIKPISDIAGYIGKDKISTSYIIPPNKSVHFYEYKMEDIKRVYKSDIFIYIGVGEPNLENIVRSKNKGYILKVIDLDDINLIYSFEFEKEEDHHHEKKSKLPHPALWLDPVNAKIIGKKILDLLKKIDSKNSYFYEKNYEKFLKDLDTLIEYGNTRFSNITNRYFISYHYTWPYFVKRFKLVYLDVIELGHGREPTAKHLIKIIKEIKRYKLKSIFASIQFYNRKYIDLIKSSTSVNVIYLDPFGIDMDYIKMMKFNIDRIYEGLKR